MIPREQPTREPVEPAHAAAAEEKFEYRLRAKMLEHPQKIRPGQTTNNSGNRCLDTIVR